LHGESLLEDKLGDFIKTLRMARHKNQQWFAK
jgi:hypothetical protein